MTATPRSKRLVAALGVGLALSAAAAGELPLSLQADGAFHTLRVPLAVRAQATTPGLADLRILDAAGTPVPHAWVDDQPGMDSAPARRSVPVFKLPQVAASAPATAAAPAPAAQGGWIVDLRGVQGVPQELQLQLAPGVDGVFPFALEASADLQAWRTVLPQAQLVALRHQGLRLDHASFDLAGLHERGGYLRLRPLGDGNTGPALALAGAQVVSLSQRAALPDWQWSEALSPAACTPAHCDYVLPRHLPLERVEVLLTQTNTLAQLALLGQPDDEPAPPAARPHPGHHHPLREHVRDNLRALRLKNPPTSAQAAPADPFWPLSGGTVYALTLQGRELRSTVLSLPGGLYRRLRVAPRGGMAQLGAQPPQLRVAGRAASLVFLARGAGPFRLAWGQSSPPATLGLAELMPGRQPDDPLPEAAQVLEAGVPRTVAAPASRPAAPAEPPARDHRLWLWAALAGALLLMGLMARSLLKVPPAAKPPEA
jgi:Protein of unknown function (DUF3999)